MSAYSIDSTNNTLTSATNWPAIAGGGPWKYVEVLNLDGASAVTYRVGTAAVTDPTSLAADTWILPAQVGASRAHELDPTQALHVDVISAGTPKVVVTAW